jgi:hypothetical protein
MEMEQMTACLLAEMNAMGEKMDSNRDRMEGKIEAEIRTTQVKTDAKMESLASWMDVNQEHSVAGLEKIKAMVEACLEKMEAYPIGMEADQEKLKVTDLEANPEEMDVMAERQKVPNKESAVETIKALEDRYGDWCWAVRRHRWPNKRSQGNGGSLQKLVTA